MRTIDYLKEKFETLDKPTESDYSDLIDRLAGGHFRGELDNHPGSSDADYSKSDSYRLSTNGKVYYLLADKTPKLLLPELDTLAAASAAQLAQLAANATAAQAAQTKADANEAAILTKAEAGLFSTVTELAADNSLLDGHVYEARGRLAVDDNGGGRFLYSKDAGDTPDEGVVITHATGRLTRIHVGNTAHVDWWGITKTDQRADDLVAIQAAIDWAAAHKAGEIRFGQGFYTISDTLDLSGIAVALKVTGAGKPDSITGQNISSVSVIVWQGGVSTNGMVRLGGSQGVLRDIGFWGHANGQTSAQHQPQSSIEWADLAGLGEGKFKFDNVTVAGVRYGVELGDSLDKNRDQMVFDKVEFIACEYAARTVTDQNMGHVFRDCRIYFCDHGFLVDGGGGVMVQNCLMVDVDIVLHLAGDIGINNSDFHFQDIRFDGNGEVPRLLVMDADATPVTRARIEFNGVFFSTASPAPTREMMEIRGSSQVVISRMSMVKHAFGGVHPIAKMHYGGNNAAECSPTLTIRDSLLSGYSGRMLDTAITLHDEGGVKSRPGWKIENCGNLGGRKYPDISSSQTSTAQRLIARDAAVWLDGTDSTSMLTAANELADVGDVVATWKSRVGTLELTQVATGPTLRDAGVEFDGTDGEMLLPAVDFSVTRPYTVLVAAKHSATNTNQAYIDGETDEAIMYWGQPNQIRHKRGGSNSAVLAVGTSPTQAWHVAYALSDIGNQTVGVDNLSAIESTPNTGTNELEGLRLGNRNAADMPLNGRIGEVIIFDRKLSNREKAILLSYLDSKWH